MNRSRDRVAPKHRAGAQIRLNNVSRANADIREKVGDYFGANANLSRKVHAVIFHEDSWFYQLENLRSYPTEWFDERRRLPWKTILLSILIPLLAAILSREDVKFNLNLTPSSPNIVSLSTATTFAPSTSPSMQQSLPIRVDVKRGHRIVTLTINSATDVSALVIDFEGNEPPYQVGELFDDMVSTQATRVWCLEQSTNTQHLDICGENNTWTAPNTGIDWRNLDLEFRFHDQTIGECVADPVNNMIYSCESLIVDMP